MCISRRRPTNALGRLRAIAQAIAGRRALARMDDRTLADIGVSRCDAAYEINRKPWDTKPRNHQR